MKIRKDMKKEIKIGDEVLTFILNDKHQISRRTVIGIYRKVNGTTVELRPFLDPEYHEKEETVIVNIKDVFIDKKEMINFIKNKRDSEIKILQKNMKNI